MYPALELIRADIEHQSALENLLELYMHDFSELVPIDVGDNGRYGYKNLSLYWADPARLPFLGRLDGKLVGFALVTRSSESAGVSEAWDMAEFFILRRYRHRGIGTDVAEKVWRLCPGRWQIRVMENNASARRFWESSVAKFLGQPLDSAPYMADGIPWRRFSFDTRR